jgi:nucleoside phosphorylase
VVKVDDQDISLVAVAAPRMGLSPAAVTASKIISNFRPRVLAMTGICAGVRGKVEQGDILVADPCFDWGAGKWVVDSSGSMQFLPAAYQWRLNDEIRSLIRSVSEEAGLLGKIHASFQGPKPRVIPRVLIDAMASGSAVLQSEDLMIKIREQHKNLIGLEMESYAIFCSAEYAASPRPVCISMKSVCDFGDSLKNDNFHEYAAHTSSNFLFELIKYGIINKLQDN